MRVAKTKVERVLRTDVWDLPVQDIIEQVEDGRLILTSESTWTPEEISRLIESLLINLPMPLLYAEGQENGTKVIIDGTQRIQAIKVYMEGKLPLTGLEILEELNGLTYDEIPPKAERTLNISNLRLVSWGAESTPHIKEALSRRLGGK